MPNYPLISSTESKQGSCMASGRYAFLVEYSERKSIIQTLYETGKNCEGGTLV